MIKRCRRCQKEFLITKQEKIYCSPNCRKLKEKYDKKSHQKNRDKILNYQKHYRQNNKQKIKEYYQNNKEKIQKYWQEYQQTHKKRIKEYLKKYYQVHKKEANQRQRKRRKKDLNFRIAKNLRSRIWYALEGNFKSIPTMSLVGCDIEYLKYHLQCRFKRGMSWDNYGKWHIDHIKPCASFDLRKPKEQLKCFNYINLQSLWAEENLNKGGKC